MRRNGEDEGLIFGLALAEIRRLRDRIRRAGAILSIDRHESRKEALAALNGESEKVSDFWFDPRVLAIVERANAYQAVMRCNSSPKKRKARK